jgi:platelet-activating factor acetylhydrolase
MIFSHGLGGSCNSYSHLVGSLASHGMVIVAPEHRDGSAPQSCINDPIAGIKRVQYAHIPHTRAPEVEQARNEQLRIRLWELGLIHDAVLGLDRGEGLNNIVPSSATRVATNPSFKSCLDVHEPGSIIWAGHSFGASTALQFVKSVFWNPSAEASSSPALSCFKPLFTFSTKTALASQVTSTSPLVLLDLWTLPLRGDDTLWLWERSLPCYANKDGNMTNVLAVLSEEFIRWERNFKSTRRALSANPAELEPNSSSQQNGPRIFYPLRSAHLSQSDFGVLFPWVTKKWMGADEPERTIRLNVRAILQMLRENGISVEDTRMIDAEEENESKATDMALVHEKPLRPGASEAQDWAIMANDGNVRAWIWVSLNEMTENERKEKL